MVDKISTINRKNMISSKDIKECLRNKVVSIRIYDNMCIAFKKPLMDIFPSCEKIVYYQNDYFVYNSKMILGKNKEMKLKEKDVYIDQKIV